MKLSEADSWPIFLLLLPLVAGAAIVFKYRSWVGVWLVLGLTLALGGYLLYGVNKEKP